MQHLTSTLICLAMAATLGGAPQTEPALAESTQSSYVLGPDDQLLIRALDAEEISEKPVRVDMSGYIRLPLVGRVHASGLTVDQLETLINERLKIYFKEPQAAVIVTEFRSQPVSVIGAVKRPGVHQLQGRKTLVEMLSLAEGIEQDAGHSIKITRLVEYGRIPLPNAVDDATGRFSVAEVSLNSVMQASNPQENLLIKPYDVISVPRAEMVYVIGQVKKAGGFVLRERESLSVLQALALAEGLERESAPQAAKILRQTADAPQRTGIAVNLKKILQGQADDVPMLPQDILFIPTSAAKNAGLRAVEVAIQVGTGVVIWRR